MLRLGVTLEEWIHVETGGLGSKHSPPCPTFSPDGERPSLSSPIKLSLPKVVDCLKPFFFYCSASQCNVLALACY